MTTNNRTAAVGDGGFPATGLNRVFRYHVRVAATTAKPYVSGDTYQLIHLPAKSRLLKACYVMVTADTGGGTVTVGGPATVITTGAVSGAAGTLVDMDTPTHNNETYCNSTDTLDIVIGTANLTTAVFDLFAWVEDLSAENAGAYKVYAS